MECRHETFLRVKQAESSDGERWITAWASTPDEDLVGDVVSPTGAQYDLPLPLLAYHKADSPVGVVTEAHVSERGIRVRAKLSRGVQLADEIWQLVRDGAIGAVSIGFKALKSKTLPSGGRLFESWRWTELSLTPVPCNTNARIISVGKSIAYAAIAESARDFDAMHAASEMVKALDTIARDSNDSSTVYAYTGRDHRFMRSGIRALFAHTADLADGMQLVAEELCARIRELESRAGIAPDAPDDPKSMHWGNYWNDCKEYDSGAVVVHNAALWIANRKTDDEPKRHSASWTLLARK